MGYFEQDENAEVAHYRTAMVCENRHIVTDDIEGSPGKKAPFCTECGAKTLTTSPNCGERIRGYYKVPHVMNLTGRVCACPALNPIAPYLVQVFLEATEHSPSS